MKSYASTDQILQNIASVKETGVYLSVETVAKGVLKLHRCYFPSAVDGKVSKREAIFRPPLTKKETIITLFSIHHGRLKILTDGK